MSQTLVTFQRAARQRQCQITFFREKKPDTSPHSLLEQYLHSTSEDVCSIIVCHNSVGAVSPTKLQYCHQVLLLRTRNIWSANFGDDYFFRAVREQIYSDPLAQATPKPRGLRYPRRLTAYQQAA